MTTYLADLAYLESGWQKNVAISIENGTITDVIPNSDDTSIERLGGAVLTGMPNLHCHAFQRALAGLTEHTTGHKDTFWTWREAMYKLATNMKPEGLKAVAMQLYSEMLKAGYTSVVEFHYVHQPDPLSMSHALIEAALATDIRLTLLPVLYQQGDFNNAPVNKRQKRFFLSLDAYLELIEALQKDTASYSKITVGIAPHSIRAVNIDNLKNLFAAHPNTLRHIHIAEQVKEVKDCLAAYKQRPVEWLLDNFDVNENWCLIHATHLSKSEVKRLARSRAVAGLCPVTEANLGDGLFELSDFLEQNGQFGIGSDSNSSVSVIEELRTLEYGQRLKYLQRNLLAGKSGSSGEQVYTRAVSGGAQALGQRVGEIKQNYAADLILLDLNHPQLVGHCPGTLLDAFIFSGNQNPISRVMVAGRWVEANPDHQIEFAKTIKELVKL